MCTTTTNTLVSNFELIQKTQNAFAHSNLLFFVIEFNFGNNRVVVYELCRSRITYRRMDIQLMMGVPATFNCEVSSVQEIAPLVLLGTCPMSNINV